MSFHLLSLYRHLFFIRLFNHYVVLHPLQGWQRKSLHLGRDVNSSSFPDGDGVVLEELKDCNSWRNCGYRSYVMSESATIVISNQTLLICSFFCFYAKIIGCFNVIVMFLHKISLNQTLVECLTFIIHDFSCDWLGRLSIPDLIHG